MIRRPPEAIVEAARLDPGRLDLFVEGIADKLFISHFCDPATVREIRVFPIDLAMEYSSNANGCKGRVLHLAAIAAQKGVQNLRFLVDSDLDHLLDLAPLPNLIRTELPDIEAHSISVNALRKTIQIGYGQQLDHIDEIHNALVFASSEIGLLRYVSLANRLNLSINGSKKDKCLSVRNELPVFDIRRFLKNVLQNSQDTTIDEPGVCSLLEGHRHHFESVPIENRIRGKDYQELFALFGRKSKHGWKEPANVMMATIERDHLRTAKHLLEISEFAGRALNTQSDT